MENRTEFNLEGNIQQWKSNLTKKNNLTKSNIVELENHLFDLVNDLESTGLSKEESFIIARKRIGKIDDICLEFDKVNNEFSFINRAIPYLKGALIYISFIVLSKLFFLITLLLSQRFSINNTTFGIISIILIGFISILVFSIMYFNLKQGKQILNKLSNAKILVALIIISHIITYRLTAEVTLPGINVSKIGFPIPGIYTMETNFAIYKIFSGFVLLATSLFFFWRNKKYNKIH